MPTNSIYDITQSNDGIMWFMTSKGVVNYNSLDWQVFADSLDLPSTAYSVIKSCKDGSIWAAGQNNNGFTIAYFLNNDWQSLSIDGLPEISSKFTFDVQSENKGYTILICHANILYSYHTVTKRLQKTPLTTANKIDVNALNIKNDQAYIATSVGLLMVDSSVRQHPVNKHLPDNKEVLQFHWNEDRLLLLGVGWLGEFKHNKFSYLSTDTGIDKKSPYNKFNLTTDYFNRIFYGSNSAAKYLEKSSSTGKTLSINGKVFNALSNRIFVDIENNVWVGDHRGLFKFNLLRFKNYNENTGLAQDEVSAVLAYKDEIILANTRHLNFLKEGTVYKKIVIGTDKGTRVLDMVRDTLQQVYIAAAKQGLLLYNGISMNQIPVYSTHDEIGVTSVTSLKSGIYFSTSDYLHKLGKNKVEQKIKYRGIRNLQSLEGDTIVAVSSSSGLFFYNSISEDTVHFVSEDRKYNNIYGIASWHGKYYVATAGGLAILKDDKIVPIALDKTLNRVAVYSLLISKNDQLWIGTNEGVFIWDGQKIVHYNRGFGLVGDEVNRNALIQDEKNRIWIGTEMGVSVYSYKEDISLNIKPKLQLLPVKTQKGTPLAKSNNLLEFDDNTIDFKFLGVSFFNEQQINYRYKLAGFDTEWIYIDNPRGNSVRYTSLPAGDYTFIVETSIGNRSWSEPEKLHFFIQEPFYNTLWFQVVSIFSILLLFYTIYRIRFIVILRNQKRLKREVFESTKEIQEMNNEIQAQNEELKMQSEEIFTTNERLEETVQERTRQLTEQNDKLSEYAFINSHQLRAPICRMIGLLNLLTITPKAEHEEILKLIHRTGIELDQVTREINHRLENVDSPLLSQPNKQD